PSRISVPASTEPRPSHTTPGLDAALEANRPEPTRLEKRETESMLRRSKPLLFSIALGLLGVTQASAVALPDSAVDCRGTIAKNYAKLMKTAHKTIAACHKSRDGGKTMAGVDCNDMTQADSKSKFSSARTKAEMAISTACAGENATLTSASSGTQFYVSCPVSCAVPNPMTTMAEVATCLGCRAENIAETAGTTALGSPTPSSLTSDDIKCRSALAKGYANVAATAYKTETSCQGDDDEAGDYDIASCVGFDPDSKVSGAQTKADGKVESSCAAAALANLDTCATDTIANLKTCSAAAFASAENDAFEITYEAHATLCPPAVRLTTRSGCSTLEETAGGCSNGGATTSSSSDGWKGYGHDQDLVDAVPLALDVSCPGAFGSCGSCTIGGISTDSVLYDGFARCAASPWIECSNVFDTDAACGGGNCTYFASPPIAQAVGGTPVCLLSRFDEDVSGTVDPDSGSANITMATRSSVYIGIAQQQPCPICEGDATPQDGNANGLCNGGARDGMACDVQGFDLTYATDADAPVSGNSLDCPPSLGLALTGATGIPREIDMKTGSTSKPASDACEAP